MKKRIIRIFLILLVVLLLFYAALKIYVAIEAKKRAEAPGNQTEYDIGSLEKHVNSPLAGKTILFLGSSVTEGAAAERQSFVELFQTLDGVMAIKEAKSGTTLVDKASALAAIAFGNGDSYVRRLRQIDTNTPIDCVVVQLSTNDATMKLPIGEISDSTDLASLDTQTVTGAMEWIIRYSQDTWCCPVVFYTGSYYDSAEYDAMVERLFELRDKWGIGVIDLYTDEAFNAIDAETYAFYMYDPIHPTKAGYYEWWFPKMEADLIEILSEKEA
ncbi:MAG: SGNH/GDSL hydrolase family protein [Oscillospiraceae bacterium]|nr:SGNH/GDSL hydrolase family protein [Oscillospiraceae bacterium]